MTDVAVRDSLMGAYTPYRERHNATAREVVDRYARDPFLHLEHGHVLVPDLVTLAPVPLEPFDHQVELGRSWIDLDYLTRTGRPRWRNVHEEKSRQMGITWIVAYLCLQALAHWDVPGLALSLKLDEIDDGGPASSTDSFFGKIRYMVTARADQDGPLAFPEHLSAPLQFVGGNKPLIRHRYRPGAALIGRGKTPDPGRGQKYGYVFIDEASRLPWGESVHKAIARACPDGRLYNSTPEGEDNVYARLRKARPEGYIFLTHHWSVHPVFGDGLHVAARSELNEKTGQLIVTAEGDPDCDLCEGNRRGLEWDAQDPACHRYGGKLTSPWYDQAVLELTDEQVASELDIDYAASLTARVYPEFDERLHVSKVPIPWVSSLQGRTELAFDYGYDTTSVVICQDAPREYRVIGEVEVHDTLPELVAAEIRAELLRLGCPPMLVQEEWTKQMLCVGDPAGEAHSAQTGTTIVQDYARHGFVIQSRYRSVEDTINAFKRLMRNRPKRLVVSSGCPKFIAHVKHNRWPTDRDGNRKPAPAPENNRHNHMMRAVAYLICWKFPPPTPTDAVNEATRGDESGRHDPDMHGDMTF